VPTLANESGEAQRVKQKCSVPFVLEARRVGAPTMETATPRGGLPAAGGAGGVGVNVGCAHDWLFFRSVPLSRRAVPPRLTSCKPFAPSLGGCEAPVMLRCVKCERVEMVRCRATRDDRCGPCAERHRKDIARVFRSGVNSDRPSGFFFVTLTAPGADVLPWDTSRCGHLAGECSGSDGCKGERLPMGVWNGSAPQRWSWFVTEMRRQLKCDVQFAGSWETQSRGALHRHVLMWAPGVTERRMRAAVRLCSARWGFGRQIDVQAIAGSDARELARKAGYCAKYATKGGDLGVTVDVATGEMLEGGYRRWSASRRWGTTMRCVRAERVAWSVANGTQPAIPDGGGNAGGAAGGLDLEQEIYAEARAAPMVLGAASV
jgi:hypothetical protein